MCPKVVLTENPPLILELASYTIKECICNKHCYFRITSILATYLLLSFDWIANLIIKRSILDVITLSHNKNNSHTVRHVTHLSVIFQTLTFHNTHYVVSRQGLSSMGMQQSRASVQIFR